jgi:hypothetical protein
MLTSRQRMHGGAVLALALSASMLLAACGGGGGGGASSGPPPFADTAAAYWVSGTGSRWVYQRIDGRAGRDATPVLKTVTDAGEQVVDGVAARRFEHSWSLFEDLPETEYRRFDGRSIINIADLAGAFGLSLPAQGYAEVPAPLVDGATTTVADQTVREDFNLDGRTDALHIVATVTVARIATLSVPAGDFSDLLRVRNLITVTATDGASGRSASASAAMTSWYAPAIGIVKRVYEDPEFAGRANTISEELVGIDAGGKRGGLLPGLTLLDDIGAGTSSATPGASAIAVAGDRVLAVATRGGTVEAAIRSSNGSPIWRGSVLQAPAGSEFGVLTASFDGTDFRIVATHRRPFDSPAQTTVVAQRLGSDGSLRDGSAGVALQTGIADTTQTIGVLRSGARDGRLLVAWGRYDTAYVPFAPGLVTQRGYVAEARLFDAANLPVASAVEVADGLPAAVGLRDDQFMVLPMPQVSSATALPVRVLSAVDGQPVGTAATLVDQRLLGRTEPVFQTVGNELWLSFGTFDPAVPGPVVPVITVMRLGRDGVLLDGTPVVPGRTLLQDDATRGNGRLALGGADNLLAWAAGWDSVQATAFDAGVLAGTAALPNAAIPLVVADPLHGIGPSRALLWAGSAGGGLMVVWLDNEQTAASPSDRITASLRLPRLTN